jgi:hypothetical protein
MANRDNQTDTKGNRDVGTPIDLTPTINAEDAATGGMTWKNAPVGEAPASGRTVLSSTRGAADIGVVKVKK